MASTTPTRLEPGDALRFAARALTGQLTVPLELVRTQLDGLGKKVDLALHSESPGLRIDGSAHAFGAPIEFSVRVEAEGVVLRGEQRLVRVMLRDVSLTTTEDAPGPLADTIRQGLIDTDNPATLVGNMVSLPPFVVEASGDTVVIDLMRVPALAEQDTARTWLAAITSYLCIRSIDVRDDAIVLSLGVLPGGPGEAARSTARALLLPAVQYLWPSGRHGA